jgi:hypothetical protein
MSKIPSSLKSYSVSFGQGSSAVTQLAWRCQVNDAIIGDFIPGGKSVATGANSNILTFDYMFVTDINSWTMFNYSSWTAGTWGSISGAPLADVENMYIHYTGAGAPSSRRAGFHMGCTHFTDFYSDWSVVKFLSGVAYGQGNGNGVEPYWSGLMIDLPFYYSLFDTLGLSGTDEYLGIPVGANYTQHPHSMNCGAQFWIIQHKLMARFGLNRVPFLLLNYSSPIYLSPYPDFPSSAVQKMARWILCEVSFEYDGGTVMNWDYMTGRNSMITGALVDYNKTIFVGMHDSFPGGTGSTAGKTLLGGLSLLLNHDRLWWGYKVSGPHAGYMSGFYYNQILSIVNLGQPTADWTRLTGFTATTGSFPVGKLLYRPYQSGATYVYLINLTGTPATTAGALYDLPVAERPYSGVFPIIKQTGVTLDGSIILSGQYIQLSGNQAYILSG